MKLEDQRPNTVIRAVIPEAAVTATSVRWFGSEALFEPMLAVHTSLVDALPQQSTAEVPR